MQFIVSGQRIAVENFVTGKLYTILWKNDTQVTLTCISIGADCVVFQGEAPLNLFTLTMQNADTIDTIEPTQLGTTNYNNLINKPSINGVDLIGNKTSAALGIRDVPAVIESDDGKVLTADEDGTYSWQELPEGTTNYNDLSNKPQINSVTLTENVSLEDLGAAAAADIPTTPADIGAEPAITSENMLDADLVDDTSSTHKFATAAQLEQIATNETNILTIEQANGAKNKLKYTSTLVAGYTTTVGEVTFTVNSDLSITATSNGSPVVDRRNFILYTGSPMFSDHDILSGGVNTQCIVSVGLTESPWTGYGVSTGDGVEMSAPPATGNIQVTCGVKAGDAVNVVFKPMICKSDMWTLSHDYQPFAMSNADITAWILAHS